MKKTRKRNKKGLDKLYQGSHDFDETFQPKLKKIKFFVQSQARLKVKTRIKR